MSPEQLDRRAQMPAITSRKTITHLLKRGLLFDMKAVAKKSGYSLTYLWRLCHARRVDHTRVLGRYYMTPVELSSLIRPIETVVKGRR